MTARHDRIRGFDQAKLASAAVLLVGAGGIGSQIGRGLPRKGIGRLYICDDDVELSNLSRQEFGDGDLHKNKALRLARNLRSQGFWGTELVGFAHMFEALQHLKAVPPADIVIVGVDNDETRRTVVHYCLAERTPGIFIAASPDADNAYVFVYQLGGGR